MVFLLQSKIVPQLFRFVAVGLTGMVIDFGLYFLLSRYTGLRSYLPLANALSMLTANFNNYYWNSRFTFSFKKGTFWSTYVSYGLISIIYIGVLDLGFWMLITWWQWPDVIAKIVLLILGTVAYFFVIRRFTFRMVE